jgi:hypothetical protein
MAPTGGEEFDEGSGVGVAGPVGLGVGVEVVVCTEVRVTVAPPKVLAYSR